MPESVLTLSQKFLTTEGENVERSLVFIITPLLYRYRCRMLKKLMKSDLSLIVTRFPIPDLFLRRLAVRNSFPFPIVKTVYWEKFSASNSAVIYGFPFILLW